jgi:hypothetical protein
VISVSQKTFQFSNISSFNAHAAWPEQGITAAIMLGGRPLSGLVYGNFAPMAISFAVYSLRDPFAALS